MNTTDKKRVLMALMFSALIFAVDLYTPVGDAVWVFYIVPLLIISAGADRRVIVAFAALSWLLIVLGYFLSPPDVNAVWDVVNRSTGMVVQFLVTLIFLKRNELRNELVTCDTELKKSIDSRRQLEEEIDQYQRMEAISMLAGGIAHDFKNILTAVIGFTELLKDRLPDDAKLQRYADRILKAGTRGNELVSQILTFSRRAKCEPVPFHTRPVLQETFGMLRAATPSSVSMTLEAASGPDLVLGDPSQFQRVILNLVTNAAQAISAEGGRIEVGLNETTIRTRDECIEPDMNPGRYLLLTVKDNGQGMSEDVLKRAFDPFFTTKGPDKGTGMGLAVVHQAVKGMGGAISVWSRPNEGTAFTVFFPLAQTVADSDGKVEQAAGGRERLFGVGGQDAIVKSG